MQFQVTTEFLDKLRAAIRSNDEKYVNEQLHELFPADIAEILDELDLEETKYLTQHLDEKQAADVLVELEEDVRERFLASLSSQEIAEKYLDNLESDEAADVIQELPEHKQDEVLFHMEDSEQASDVVELLKYDENTAGGLMKKELVSVNVNSSMLDCVRQMREHADHIEDVYTIYVVDEKENLLGLVPLKKVLTTSLRVMIRDIMETEIISVKTSMDAEEVARLMEKYDLVFVPVIDNLGRLMGRITIDDVLDVIRKEETEDVQKMAGMEALEESYMSSSLMKMVKKRVGWLIILFVGESFTAAAMSFFQARIERAVVLAFFIPLIISSGGNTGSQASSLIIRALALGELGIREWWKIFNRELRVGLLLGVILGMVGFLCVATWQAAAHFFGPDWLIIGLAVGLSLIGVVLWGNLIGSLFPIFLKRIGLDPAVSSAPFVATFVDVTGLIIYFSMVSLLLSKMIS